MKTLTKLTALLLLAALLFSFAACTGTVVNGKEDPVQGATATKKTPEQPNAPTEEPSFVELQNRQRALLSEAFAAVSATPFESCAEKVMSLAPCDPGPLCFITENNGNKGFVTAPSKLAVDGGKIYVNDIGDCPEGENSIFVYDMVSKTASRVPCLTKTLEYNLMTVLNGKLYTTHSVEDLATGELTEFAGCINDDQEIYGTCILYSDHGSVRLFEGMDKAEQPWSGNSYCFTLDMQTNEWSNKQGAVTPEAPFKCTWVNTVGFGQDGSFCVLAWPEANDDSFGTPYIARVDVDGSLLAYTKLPYTNEEFYAANVEPGICYAPDGNIYLMVYSLDEVAVWRINLG